ncbi:putative neutral ceramidase superfamily lipid hydrolase [Breznakia sp. PF5-3]|uniref:hypothetical protein n=1 Tax=unclassified Breznakia TaxID=2623764 RepID=UPI0024075863|nr:MULTISPECIES: hypothetical protein [unclassified Breznakia]MDF9824488.1 putative neutral ceramidase superfamily lipid hydrolase [Breznakia sp. PM6-1]MDF9835229.1 putative neutral ceramidase superfamily lipid hydrolase [Breznakia sp. PF5-3]MDF9837443.1 putative neutral ceramidase superfamily lipid hydrolase [Breznakia sp. PFB2-8]MDF9859379.1 putative neutral ceramidase superfamily lipid hydrolase [Breznakia sp. PH5-24]
MLVFSTLKKIRQIFTESYKSIHFIPWIISILIFVIFFLIKNDAIIKNITDNYLEILNAISILSTFFLFGMENIDFKKMLKKLSVQRKTKGIFITEGTSLINTYYSFLLIQVFLISVQYLLFLFSIYFVFLLILTIMYMIIGFLFVILSWHGFLELDNH